MGSWRSYKTANLQDGDVIGLRSDLFHQLGIEFGTGHGRPESNLAVTGDGDVQETLFVLSLTSRLEKGSEKGGLLVKVLELLLIQVIKNHMEAHDVLDDFIRLASEGFEGGVFYDEDGDGLALVDVICDLGLAQQICVSGEFLVFAENLCDVEGEAGGGEEEQQREEERETF